MVTIGGSPKSSGTHSYKLKVGEVVLLKSDADEALPMTVSMLAGPFKGQVIVEWRDKSGKPQKAAYHEDMLRTVVPAGR